MLQAALQAARDMLRGKKTIASADLDKAISELSVKAAEQEVARLEAERSRVLIDGSDKELTAVEEKLRLARINVERTAATITELERRREDTAEEEAQAVKRKRYGEAQAALVLAEKRLQAEYEPAARAIVAVLGEVAEALENANAVNQDLPANTEQLFIPPVLTRTAPGLPEKVLKRKAVEGWTMDFSGEWLRDQHAVEPVKDRPGTGLAPGGIPCSWATFDQVTYLERTSADGYPALFSTVSLPAIIGSDLAFWEPVETATAAAIEAKRRLAAQRMDKAPAPKRDPKVKHLTRPDMVPAPAPQPAPPTPEDEEAEIERWAKLGDRRAVGNSVVSGIGDNIVGGVSLRR